MLRRLTFLFAMFVALFAPRAAFAHPAPRSVVLLDVHASDVGAELRLPVPELEAALGHAPLAAPGVITDAERLALNQLISSQFRVFSPDHVSWSVELGELSYAVDEPAPVVVARVALVPPPGHSARVFTLQDEVIARAVPNHASWILLRSDVASPAPKEPSVLGVTRYLHRSVDVNRALSGTPSVFRSLFRAGMRHIASGTDHLLFLFALLLPVPLSSRRESLLRVLRVVTAFTLGHSLTLLLGACGVLRLPSAPVEISIAASILVSAIHAVRPIFPGREAWIAAGFGLVHGLAFAGALSELALGRSELLAALFGFNSGIEAMQLVVVAVSLPWLLLLASTRVYDRFRVVAAAAIGLCALGWLGQRALRLPNPLDGAVSEVASHPALLVSGLASFTLFARRNPRADRELDGMTHAVSSTH